MALALLISANHQVRENQRGRNELRRKALIITSVNRTIERREAPPLPANMEDWVRVIKHERSFNDLIEDIHGALVNEEEEYRQLLRATYDQHAVEGSLAADNVLASLMIRKRASEKGVVEIASEKLAIINLALGVVLRRYNASRKQRRNTLHGEEVPPENNNE